MGDERFTKLSDLALIITRALNEECELEEHGVDEVPVFNTVLKTLVSQACAGVSPQGEWGEDLDHLRPSSTSAHSSYRNEALNEAGERWDDDYGRDPRHVLTQT